MNRCYNSFEEPFFFPLVAVLDAVLLVPFCSFFVHFFFCSSNSDDKLRARVQVAQTLNSQHKESMFREEKIQRSKWSLTWLKAMFDMFNVYIYSHCFGNVLSVFRSTQISVCKICMKILETTSKQFLFKAVVVNAMLSFYYLTGRLQFPSSLPCLFWKSDILTDCRPASSWVSKCQF